MTVFEFSYSIHYRNGTVQDWFNVTVRARTELAAFLKAKLMFRKEFPEGEIVTIGMPMVEVL